MLHAARKNTLRSIVRAGHTAALAALIAFALASPSQALAGPLSEKFNAWTTSHVRYEKCNAGTQALAQAAFKRGVVPAIAKMMEINPELMLPKMNASFSKMLTLSCEKSAGGMADFGSGKNRSTIRLGRLIDGSSTATEARIFLVHEYFHFLKLDNLETELHNHERFLKDPDQNGIFGVERDVIYSCMIAVEPLSAYLTAILPNGRRAEANCRSARPTESGSVTGHESEAKKPTGNRRTGPRPMIESAYGISPSDSVSALRSTTASSLNTWLERRVSYADCSPYDLQIAKQLMREATLNGFERLERINPKLVRERMSSHYMNRRLEISCLYSLEGALATFSALPVAGRNARTPEIKLGRLLSYGVPQEKRLLSLFHETLHFFDFDNLPSELHNSRDYLHTIFPEGRRGLERDVVYSCAHSAFPPETFSRKNIQMANATCSAAVAAHRKTEL